MKLPLEIKRLIGAANELNEIVEGLRNSDWRNQYGVRIKDTNEWCKFYTALAKANDKMNEPQPE